MSNTKGIKIIGNYSYNQKYCIGEGSFGKVFEGMDTRTQQKVAIKQMYLKNFENDEYLKQSLNSEIEILKKLDHPNIVKLYDVLQTTNSLYIITEFCKDGDLKMLLNKKKIFQQQAQEIFFHMIEGFKELQTHQVIHRDMKPANILVHGNQYKIADFGFARQVKDYNNTMVKSCVGSPLYMSPQLLQRKQYTSKSDVWSIGVIFYECLYGQSPWKGNDEQDLLNNILTKPLQLGKNVQIDKLSELILNLTLQIEEKNRASWDNLFEIINKQKMIPKILQDQNQNKIDEIKIKNKDPQSDQDHLIKVLDTIQTEISFKHYVCVEMSMKYQLIKPFFKEEFIYEKFQIISGLLIKNAAEQLNQDIQNKENRRPELFLNNEKIEYLKSIFQNSNEFYKEFFNDQLRPQKTQIFKEDQNFKNFIESDQNEQQRTEIIRLLSEYGQKIIQTVLIKIQQQLNSNKKENTDFRQILVTIDYMIEFLISILRRDIKLDYNTIHKQKRSKVEIQYYLNQLQQQFKNQLL